MPEEEKFVWLLWYDYNCETPATLFAVYSTYEAAKADLDNGKLYNGKIEMEELY